jgi:hypothetical protein
MQQANINLIQAHTVQHTCQHFILFLYISTNLHSLVEPRRIPVDMYISMYEYVRAGTGVVCPEKTSNALGLRY